MLTPKVSVIIPAYNSERFIRDSVGSVLAQSYANIECIIVNDGSTDGTADIARCYGDRVVVIDQANRKLPEARNTGIRHASGEFISFLDADDRIAATKIEHQMTYLEQHPDCGAVYSRVQYFDEDRPEEFYSPRRPTPEGDILDRLLFGNFIPVHATLFRKSVVEAVEGFRSFPALEDWDFLLRLCMVGCRFGFLDEVVADYRMHSGGMSRDSILMFDAKFQVVSDLARLYDSAISAHGLDADCIVGYHQADLGKALILNGRAKDGIAAISEAVKKDIPKRTSFLVLAALARVFGSRIIRILYERTYAQRKLTQAKR